MITDFMIPIELLFLNCLYIYVYDWLFVGFSLLSGASYKALNFSQVFVDSALSRVYHPSAETRFQQLVNFNSEFSQQPQKQCRGNAEALISLSPIIDAYRGHKTVVSYGVLVTLLFDCNLVCNKFNFPTAFALIYLNEL